MPPKTNLSPAALETLAIVAYTQPTTKGDIEGIRGVSADSVIATLVDRRFLTESGRKDVPGRPILYKTTAEFLEAFGLRSLEELPPVDVDGTSPVELALALPIQTVLAPHEGETAVEATSGRRGRGPSGRSGSTEPHRDAGRDDRRARNGATTITRLAGSPPASPSNDLAPDDVWAQIDKNCQRVALMHELIQPGEQFSPHRRPKRGDREAQGRPRRRQVRVLAQGADRLGQDRGDAARRGRHDPRDRRLHLHPRAHARLDPPACHVLQRTARRHGHRRRPDPRRRFAGRTPHRRSRHRERRDPRRRRLGDDAHDRPPLGDPRQERPADRRRRQRVRRARALAIAARPRLPDAVRDRHARRAAAVPRPHRRDGQRRRDEGHAVRRAADEDPQGRRRVGRTAGGATHARRTR